MFGLNFGRYIWADMGQGRFSVEHYRPDMFNSHLILVKIAQFDIVLPSRDTLYLAAAAQRTYDRGRERGIENARSRFTAILNREELDR